MKKLWPLLVLAALVVGCNDAATVAADLHLTEESVTLAADKFKDPEGASLSPTHSDYVNNLFGNVNPAGVDVNLGLPNYAYFQGLLYSKQNIFMAGQVRVVGGLVAQGNVTVAGEGMVTSNPESQLNRISVTKARWKVEAWVQE
ncbi:MAG: hypothetical protein U0931_22580 [Vulcanimicrobiota bacterium]